MATGTIMPAPWFTGLNDNGDPLVGGKLYTYAAGTMLLLPTFTDVNLSIAHPNPVILDGAGRASVYLAPASYKFLLKDADDVTIRTQDNISATATTPGSTVDIQGVAGETVAAGQVVYLSDGSGGLIAGRWYLADADLTYASSLPVIGMAPFGMVSGITGTVRLIGRVEVSTPLSPGATYWVDAQPGSLGAAAGANVRVVGVADTANSIVIAPNPPAAAGGGAPYVYTYEQIALVDGATVPLNCNDSQMDGTKVFYLIAAGDRTLLPPTNPLPGMRLVIRHFAQGANRLLTLSGGANGFVFGSDVTALTPTISGKVDVIGCMYDGSVWDVVAVSKGY